MDMERCKKFANGRVSASGDHYVGKDFEKALERGPRYFPRVAGCTVAPTKNGARYGYKTKEGALRAARDFRQKCRDLLASI